MPEIELAGCRPYPLISYLKALGVFRIASEQWDTALRGAWKNERFVLHTAYRRSDLKAFFEQSYKPTPILAPWNGGCGFYLKLNPKAKKDQEKFKSREVVDAVQRLEGSSSVRLEGYRGEISITKRLLRDLAFSEDLETLLSEKNMEDRKKFLDSSLLFEMDGRTLVLDKENKDAFLAALRSRVLGDSGILWLDAALVLTTGQKKNRQEAPMLGSGGNVGNLDFSAMFVQALPYVIPFEEGASLPTDASRWLDSALFDSPTRDLPKLSVGQYDPGKAGGTNMTHGISGPSILNPWDFILMCEGSLLVSGAVARRLSTSRTTGSFPFSVSSSGVGYGSAGKENTRGELWLPVWKRPARVTEIRHLLGEGRAELGARPASTGITFAQAVASMGVDRGIDAFIRYEFQKRFGDSYLATPLGRFEVRSQPHVQILQQLERGGWNERFRRLCETTKPAPPPRFPTSLRRLDAAIFGYCRYGGTHRFTEILIALGQVERELSVTNGTVVHGQSAPLPPMPLLGREWLEACDDGSVEFRIATAIASIRSLKQDNGKVALGSLRTNLEPVEWTGNRYQWAEERRSTVWSTGGLCRNLAAALERRVMEAGRSKLEGLPLDASAYATVEDVTQFLLRGTDDARIEDLLWGLILVRPGPTNLKSRPFNEYPTTVPRCYALLKLLFLPERSALKSRSDGRPIRGEPTILAYLRAGRIGDACEIAARRLRISGFTPMPGPLGTGEPRRMEFIGKLDPLRLEAALLTPVMSTVRLKQMVLRQETKETTLED